MESDITLLLEVLALVVNVWTPQAKASLAVNVRVWLWRFNRLAASKCFNSRRTDNHLDLDMRHALTMALQDFEGAVVLVSHERQ